VLHDRYDEICEQFLPLGFEAYGDDTAYPPAGDLTE
jgi:hypothetical protein